jgi:hypothetical protein
VCCVQYSGEAGKYIFRKPGYKVYKYPKLGCTAVGDIYGEQALEIN